jgi:hypothetical protein
MITKKTYSSTNTQQKTIFDDCIKKIFNIINTIIVLNKEMPSTDSDNKSTDYVKSVVFPMWNFYDDGTKLQPDHETPYATSNATDSNIEILKSHKFASSQPLLVALLKDKIVAIYLVSSLGKINQVYGTVDYLNEVEEIFDLTDKFLKTYNIISDILLNTFKSLSPEEIITFKKELNVLEEKLFSNYISNDITFEIIKRHISRDIRKTNLSDILNLLGITLEKKELPNDISGRLDLNTNTITVEKRHHLIEIHSARHNL